MENRLASVSLDILANFANLKSTIVSMTHVESMELVNRTLAGSGVLVTWALKV